MVYVFWGYSSGKSGGKMTGHIKTIKSDKAFGFIKSDLDSKEYFFHRTDLLDLWERLVEDFEAGDKINVTFEVVASHKGPRAGEVKRV